MQCKFCGSILVTIENDDEDGDLYLHYCEKCKKTFALPKIEHNFIEKEVRVIPALTREQSRASDKFWEDHCHDHDNDQM